MSGICVILEQRGGEAKRASIEALAEALRNKDALGGSVTAVLIGSGMTAAAEQMKSSGADKVVVYDRGDLAHYSAEGYRACAAQAIQAAHATTVFVAATVQGRDLAPGLAGSACLDAGYAAECTNIEVDDGRILATRPVYAGKAIVKVSCNSDVFVLSLRPNVFRASLPGGDGVIESADPPFPEGELGAHVTSIADSAGGSKDVAEADVVVSGGRGVGGPEGFATIEALAAALNGAVGASRAVVDLGWRPHAEQVGQTGKVVSPTLYVACGISGAIQHLAGMRTSKVIVAINKDAEAPIFKVADYGIVGDLFDVVPALTKAVGELAD
ncbi:MAG: electron transfer flavoprotein subunit alpha [Planctomycetes bacterium]|nr:electron transfer flavoprotein subunit alpha [Planctomycetota bacterium]